MTSRKLIPLVVLLILSLTPTLLHAGPYGIPEQCMKNSTHIDLNKINVKKKCKGWYLVKDRAGHGGSTYKACNKKGEAKASIAKDGKVLRGVSTSRCY